MGPVKLKDLVEMIHFIFFEPQVVWESLYLVPSKDGEEAPVYLGE